MAVEAKNDPIAKTTMPIRNILFRPTRSLSLPNVMRSVAIVSAYPDRPFDLAKLSLEVA